MLRVFIMMLLTARTWSLDVIPLIDSRLEIISKIEKPISDISSQLVVSSPIGVPVKSHATFGTVTLKRIDPSLFNQPIFIIGGDEYSKNWLQLHQKQLQVMQAIGFITNVNDVNSIIALQEQSHLPLLPVNVDSLMDFIHVTHYPLVIEKVCVWQ